VLKNAQLSDQHGAQLVARHRGLPADHLEWLSETGARAMADAGTIAVMLPGAFYFLRETRVPPIQLMRDPHGGCRPTAIPAPRQYRRYWRR